MSVWHREKPDFMGRPSDLVARQVPGRPPTPATAPGRLARLIPESVRRWVMGRASRVHESMGGGTLLGQWGSQDEDFQGYRPLHSRIDSITRDLDAWTYDRQIRMALYLYATNPMAAWLVDKLTEVTIGEQAGFTVKVDPGRAKLTDKEADLVQGEITDHLKVFWKHPAHSLEARASEYATTMLVTGAILLPVTVNEIDGVPTLDLIDAQQIARVAAAEKSAIVPGTVFYRAANAVGEPKPLEVIRQRERDGVLKGEAFYFPLRKLLNQLMGTSYLLRAIDWLDRHDQFLFAGLDRAKIGNSFAWHVVMEGMTPEQCAAEAKRHKREGTFTEPGSVVVTNEKGNLEAVGPELNAGDTDTLARVYRTHILGSYSFPESWYSAGSETNRATAGDQTDVALRSLETWQHRFGRMFQSMLHYTYDAGRQRQSTLRRSWPERSSGAVTIAMDLPPIRERDYVRIGDAVASIESGLKAAVDDEMLSLETSRKVFVLAASKLGADIDLQHEEEQIEAERADRERKEQERMNAAARDAMARGLGGDPDEPPEPRDKGVVEP